MSGATAPGYEPTVGSLRRHPVPAWYHDAKFGIFIHWGLYSVPAFAPRLGSITDVLREHWDDAIALSPYTEWYENAIKLPETPSARHHADVWSGRPYADFRELFAAGLEKWDPGAWAALFDEVGARYVVLVTKHHDGYCLWPSQVPHPHRESWHTDRDIVGELARAVRARGMRFGVYYSGGIDWSFCPEPIRNPLEWLASVPTDPAYQEYALAQCRELIARYQPDLLWNDIAWPTSPERLWALLADYYNAVPDGVVNDRWHTPGWLHRGLQYAPLRRLANAAARRLVARRGIQLTSPPPPHYDFLTPEYTTFETIRQKKWEATRGIGHSFAWNRNEESVSYLSADELVRSFVDGVSKNGNLLLNVGPRGEDAGIPEEQMAPLRGFGRWLASNADAIYGSRPWKRAEGVTADGIPVRFTARGALRYAIVLGAPKGERVRIRDLAVARESQLRWLGRPREELAEWTQQGSDLVVTLPSSLEEAPALEISC